jgi:peptidoglycan/xylan/chitin deacetylase (PgdA/CDA1 family)
MKNRKFLLVTFDYELFLGARSGLVEDCMLSPTRALLEIMNEFNVKAIFFVDTTYLLRLKEQSVTNLACKKDLEKISDQLRGLINDGHYVMPHIHPHWLDAKYLSEIHQYDLSEVKHYRFHKISEAERTAIFDGSMELLYSIIKPQFPDYSIDGFRAGGWSIQPFSDFKPHFLRNGIRYDFTVIPRHYYFTSAQYYDFSTVEEGRTVYRFDEDICVERKDGPFMQFCISCFPIQSYVENIDRIHRKILFKLINDHSHNRGRGQIARVLSEVTPASQKGHPTSDKSSEVASIETMSMVKLPAYQRYLAKEEYMHFVSHPKILSKHNLFTFRQFLKNAVSRYEVISDYRIIANYTQKEKQTATV